MIKVVEILSLSLWSIYFLLGIYREIRRNREATFKELIKHPFHFIRVDSLFFLIIYLLYNYIARDEVLPYLYLVIIITNIVYLLYDLVDNYKFNKIRKEEYIYFIVGVLVIISLFIYLYLCKNSLRVASISLFFNLLIPSLVSLIKLTKKN